MDTFLLVAEPRRREILRLVWDHEMAVGDIANQVDVSMAAVSQHLATLKQAGFVSVRVDGKRRLYQADRDALAELVPMLRLMWQADLDKLAEAAEKAHRRDIEEKA